MLSHTQSVCKTITDVMPFFQPIYNLTNNHVIRYECFARSLDERHQFNPPHQMLHIVERDKTTTDVTLRMLALSNAFFANKKIRWSLNLYTGDLNSIDVQKQLSDICNRSARGIFGIELSYQIVKHSLPDVRYFRKEFPNLHITVDDVDECSESLHGLIASGIDAVKMRGQLVTKISQSYRARKTTACVQQYCKKYDVDLIAEYIEDEDVLSAVNSLDIQFGQGFYLSHLRNAQ